MIHSIHASALRAGGAHDALNPAALDLMDALLDQVHDQPFFVKDENLHYARANRAMAELCGAGAVRDMVGKSASDFFSSPQCSLFEDLDRQVMRSGRPMYDQVVKSERKDGETAWLVFGRWPVFADDGRVRGVAAIARNLTLANARGEGAFRIGPVLDHVRRNYAAPIKVGTLASLAEVSVSQLERDFARVLGMSPRAYQRKIRLEHARELLSETDRAIADIAQACGYSDQSAFTRTFHKWAGCSPRTFRRKAASS